MNIIPSKAQIEIGVHLIDPLLEEERRIAIPTIIDKSEKPSRYGQVVVFVPAEDFTLLDSRTSLELAPHYKVDEKLLKKMGISVEEYRGEISNPPWRRNRSRRTIEKKDRDRPERGSESRLHYLIIETPDNSDLGLRYVDHWRTHRLQLETYRLFTAVSFYYSGPHSIRRVLREKKKNSPQGHWWESLPEEVDFETGPWCRERAKWFNSGYENNNWGYEAMWWYDSNETYKHWRQWTHPDPDTQKLFRRQLKVSDSESEDNEADLTSYVNESSMHEPSTIGQSKESKCTLPPWYVDYNIGGGRGSSSDETDVREHE